MFLQYLSGCDLESISDFMPQVIPHYWSTRPRFTSLELDSEEEADGKKWKMDCKGALQKRESAPSPLSPGNNISSSRCHMMSPKSIKNA